MANKLQVAMVVTGIDQLSLQLKGAQKEASTLSKSLSGLGNIPFMDTLTGKEGLMKPFVDGAKAAIAFESSMDKVRRAVEFQTPEQFKTMSKDVLDLSEKLPVSAAGIAQVFALGGQSGIAREELKAFAEDALKVGIAFDQTGEQSGAMMASWRTDFKLNQTEAMALADQITQLGRAGGVDAGKVSRIVTASSSSGLSSGQAAAMGAVFAKGGVSEEAAASSMRNFAQTLNAGTLATEGQKQAFKALGLDAQAVSEGMSADAEGTISNVLTKLNALETGQQSAMLSQLFGDQSAAPLVAGLDSLSRNFQLVGNSQQYAGSVQEAYAATALTTASQLQVMDNRTTRLGIAIGTALLPPVNDFLGTIGPLISKVSAFTEANPGLVRSIAGAAAGFTVLRLAVVAATVASAFMSTVIGANPVGLIVRGIALAAGLLIANWSSVAGFFQEVWTTIKTAGMVAWGWITEFFSWTPLNLVQKNWGPIFAWLKFMWATVEPIVSPLMAFFGGSGTVKVNTNVGGGTGQFLKANAAQLVRDEQAQRNLTQGGASATSLLRPPDQAGTPGSLIMAGSLNQLAAVNNRTNLQGVLTVQFQNAPPGTTVGEAQTNQPGFSISQKGVRSLSQQ